VKKFICIHGHFYQPPREDPWTEQVPSEESAAPYHDWNQKITRECYAPNLEAKILDREGRIREHFNNFLHMSFDVGPTLLEWLRDNESSVYEGILSADQGSLELNSGHGNAMAQCYNHMILPLATRRDKETQVIWGIRDFEYRFGRTPEGLWLPDTAVDLESLALMAREGIRFSILAPRQAQSFRWLGEVKWMETKDRPLDPRVPYRLNLPRGESITLFFFHDPLSREMALAYSLERLQGEKVTAVTNYGAFLERFSVHHEVRIWENTSWSCAHGVERWRSDCGCHVGGKPGWNQAWRRPLRETLDWLRDAVNPSFEEAASRLLRDPWEARNDFISLLLEHTPENRRSFFATHALSRPDIHEEVRILELMEMQRNLMFMFTSCGWFFDDPAGLETLLILKHAAKAAETATSLLGLKLEPELSRRLEAINSNDPVQGTGRDLWLKAQRYNPKRP